MSWEIITKQEVAQFIRMPTAEISDLWYDMTLALIEDHTGWYSLDNSETIQEDLDGDGSAFLRTQLPVNSVTTIAMNGIALPSSYYNVRWDGVSMRTYISDTTMIDHVMFHNMYEWGFFFPIGIGNIGITYSAGGTASMPQKYINKIRLAVCLCVKELSIVPRNEGSDQVLREYVPRKQTKRGEVLKSFGIHGKLMGIIESMMPIRMRYS